MTETQPQTVKKTYTKPEIIRVRLVPEEAVLGACKDGNGIQFDCLPDLSCTSATTSN